MIDTRLVLLDGLPGSGKSTTAQRLYLHMLRHEVDARWSVEFAAAHPIFNAAALAQYIQHRVVDTDDVRRHFLQSWRAFAAANREGSAVTIFDGMLFQVPTGILLLQNEDRPRIVDHVLEVAAIAEPLHPLLIYLYQEDVSAAITAICELRREDAFAETLIKLVGDTPYGDAHQVRDLADVIAFYERQRELTDSIRRQLAISCWEFEVSAGWTLCEQQITRALSLPEMEPAAAVQAADRYSGRYQSPGEADDWQVKVGSAGIYLDRKRLVHKQNNTFMLEASCVELRFEEDAEGKIRGFRLHGSTEPHNCEWTKVT